MFVGSREKDAKMVLGLRKVELVEGASFLTPSIGDDRVDVGSRGKEIK